MAILDVVKFESSADILAWKFPKSKLTTKTTLIVAESQEAIFFRNGQALDTFGPGRYQLTTDNLPLLQGLVNLPTGGKAPFSAEVWFVNKAYSLNILWGTSTPIQLQDPKYGVFVPVRAFGQFGVRVDDVKKFLIKLVGTLRLFDTKTLTSYFKGFYLTHAKTMISKCLVEQKIPVLEINANLLALSESLKSQLQGVFDEYGITLVSFMLNPISVPDDDPGVQRLKAALAKTAEMSVLGYDYRTERSFDTMEHAASNEGGGAGLMNAGVGLGMGLGLGGPLGKLMGQVASQLQTQPPASASSSEATITCDKCGASYPKGSRFCPNCGDAFNPCPRCGADMPEGKPCPKCGFVPKKCPNCGATLADGVKFCPECGSAIVKKCSACGTELAPGARFCSECGAKA